MQLVLVERVEKTTIPLIALVVLGSPCLSTPGQLFVIKTIFQNVRVVIQRYSFNYYFLIIKVL